MIAERIERLLLLQPRWLGDVLLCTPAIREARRALPDARIDFATEPAGGEVLRNNPYLDQVLVDGKTFASRLRLLRRVASGRYDAVVDFRSTGSTAQLTAVSRARTRVGVRGRGPRNLAYTRLLDRISLDIYAARHKLNTLGGLGIDVSTVADLSLDLPIGDAARDRAAGIWRTHGLDGERVVAISPASREAFKQWGAENWAAAADHLADDGFRILLTSGPGENEQLERVVEAMRHQPVWDYGRTSVEEAAAIVGRCLAWTGNDGGAKHIAAATGTPTLSVIRCGIGEVWTDPGDPRQRYLERRPPGGSDPDCARCSGAGCLAALAPVEIARSVRELIADSR